MAVLGSDLEKTVVTHGLFWGGFSKKQKSGSPFKYSYILVFLASAVNSELTRQELVGVTVSGRLLSPFQLNYRQEFNAGG